MGFVARVCQPSTLRMLICPEASSAQNIIAAVSADGSTVWVLIRRLNSSCNRSMAFVVRALLHCSGGSRVKVNSRSPASSRLVARVPVGLDLAPHAADRVLADGTAEEGRQRAADATRIATGEIATGDQSF